MKKYIAILAILIFSSCHVEKNTQDREKLKMKDLEISILSIINAYNAKDSATLNNFVHPKAGLYMVYRPGSLDAYKKEKKFSFSSPIWNYGPYDKVIINSDLKFEKTPELSCDSSEWNKKGLYCDLTNTAHILSQIAENLKTLDIETSKEEIAQLYKIEEDSKEVIACDDNGKSFIFYMKFIEGRWYLVIVDRAYGSCDI